MTLTIFEDCSLIFNNHVNSMSIRKYCNCLKQLGHILKKYLKKRWQIGGYFDCLKLRGHIFNKIFYKVYHLVYIFCHHPVGDQEKWGAHDEPERWNNWNILWFFSISVRLNGTKTLTDREGFSLSLVVPQESLLTHVEMSHLQITSSTFFWKQNLEAGRLEFIFLFWQNKL